ncbi:MAG TPA: nucleotidyltransferase domain-containing protein [Archaeoglobaceae archaeon]|nr:nucleotidyltransferase domain-containing protein [Archaeoglobaceae archaeon]
MRNDKKNLLDIFVRSLKEKHRDKIEKIILFGSVARGENKEHSDVDVLIITNYDSFKMQKLVSEIVVNILLKTVVYISAKVLTEDEFDFLRKMKSFYRSVMEEGITVG